MAVCFEMIVSETWTTVQLFKNMSFVADFHSKVELYWVNGVFANWEAPVSLFNGYSVISGTVTLI